MVAATVAAAAASAADWKYGISGSASVTATDNAALRPPGQERGDLILTLTPGFRASREGANLRANVNYQPTALFYTQGTSSSRLINTLNAFGRAEGFDKRLFVDATANISQQFLSPFGPRPLALTTDTSNRTTVQTYGLSPGFRGTFGNGMPYSLVNSATWTLPGEGARGFSNFTVARLASAPARVGWDLEANRRTLSFPDQPDLTNSLYRGRLIWTVDPQLRLYGSGGYETNNYTLTDQSGAIYGGGLDWTPTPRTTVTGNYEQRFFGPSYLASIAHRTPLSTWSLLANRTLSSYPQAVQQGPVGDTAAILNGLLLTRFPDPVQRAAEVQRLIQTQGLPPVLTTPLSFFTQQVFESERITATVGLLGVRNTVTFVAFTGWNQNIPAGVTLLPDDTFANVTKFNQTGVSANWTHRLTPLTSVSGLASYVTSKSDGAVNATNSSTQLYLLGVSRPFSPRTTGSLNLRYTIFDATGADDYEERAIVATLFHSF